MRYFWLRRLLTPTAMVEMLHTAHFGQIPPFFNFIVAKGQSYKFAATQYWVSK